MAEKIKNYLLYAGVDRESYQHIKPKIEKTNRITAMVFSVVAFILVSVMMGLSFFQEGFMKSQPVYLLGMICSLVLLLLSLGARRYPFMSYLAVYLAAAVFFHYGIAIGVMTRPEEQTVTFMVLLLFIPLIFVDKPIRMISCLLYFVTIFIIEVVRVKTGAVRAVDVTDAIVFGILGMVSGTIVIQSKVNGYVLERKLQIMSEMDQLTGLNNRNCYELRLSDYPLRCKNSLGCIYIDVNGLHDLNNTKGHKEGDVMLKFVAGEVQRQFGIKDTYRIGGDEYVAFVIDCEEEQVQDKIDILRKYVSERFYHIAVGYEIQNADNVNIDQLIVQAESKMYTDKEEYYRKHESDMR